MKMKLIPFYLFALFSAASWATEINTCKTALLTRSLLPGLCAPVPPACLPRMNC
ncbi:hypothetical protein G3D33_000188 [Salmonella enterica subsp. salamae]|nr:hypothetical protein [Salmonella enterica subsp. salamae]